jgi:hypothetical protein
MHTYVCSLVWLNKLLQTCLPFAWIGAVMHYRVVSCCKGCKQPVSAPLQRCMNVYCGDAGHLSKSVFDTHTPNWCPTIAVVCSLPAQFDQLVDHCVAFQTIAPAHPLCCVACCGAKGAYLHRTDATMMQQPNVACNPLIDHWRQAASGSGPVWPLYLKLCVGGIVSRHGMAFLQK